MQIPGGLLKSDARVIVRLPPGAAAADVPDAAEAERDVVRGLL